MPATSGVCPRCLLERRSTGGAVAAVGVVGACDLGCLVKDCKPLFLVHLGAFLVSSLAERRLCAIASSAFCGSPGRYASGWVGMATGVAVRNAGGCVLGIGTGAVAGVCAGTGLDSRVGNGGGSSGTCTCIFSF